MSFKGFVAVLAFASLSVSTATVAHAAETDETWLADNSVVVPVAPIPGYVPEVKRPAILPVLYATLGGMQAWDLYSTNAAKNAGAREANPAAATTASTIFFAERLWKKNKTAAIVMLAAINGTTAAVSMHNMRNARVATAGR